MIVGICDEDKAWYCQAKQIIEEYALDKKINIDFIILDMKNDLQNYKGSPIDVLFINIEFKSDYSGTNLTEIIDSIQIASWINKRWKNCQIVYLTNYVYYATDVCQREYVHFVLKEHFKNHIPEIMNNLLYYMEPMRNKIVFSTVGGNILSIAPKDIIYFERNKRVTNVVTVWGEYEIWDKISTLCERLSHMNFVRCHNSYIVSLSSIREFKKDLLIMDNSVEISVSRTYRKKVIEAFTNWVNSQV